MFKVVCVSLMAIVLSGLATAILVIPTPTKPVDDPVVLNVLDQHTKNIGSLVNVLEYQRDRIKELETKIEAQDARLAKLEGK